MPQKQPPPNDTQERNTEIALFRYSLIGALLLDPRAASLACHCPRTYSVHPSQVSVSSVRRYLQLCTQGGYEPKTNYRRYWPAEIL